MQNVPCSHTSHTSHVSRTERRPIDGEILLHQRDLARGAARLTGPPRVLAPQVGRSATSVSHLEQTQGCRSTAWTAVDRQPSGAGCPPPQANGTAPHLYRPDRHRAVPGDEHLLCSTRRTVVIRSIHRAWRCWPFWPAALLFHAVADSGARWAGTCNIGCGRTPERWRVRVRHRTAGGCLEEGAAGPRLAGANRSSNGGLRLRGGMRTPARHVLSTDTCAHARRKTSLFALRTSHPQRHRQTVGTVACTDRSAYR